MTGAEREMEKEKASQETTFTLFTGMSPGFKMICCLAFASTIQCVFAGAMGWG